MLFVYCFKGLFISKEWLECETIMTHKTPFELKWLTSVFESIKNWKNIKISCAAANSRLLRGKPLCYGTIGLAIGNSYLTSKINVILAKRNSIVVLRRKSDAMTLLLNVKRFRSCWNTVTEIKMRILVLVSLLQWQGLKDKQELL